MATSINQFNDDKELLLSRIKDLEFVNDVSEFKCKRCEKVLIQHYISNCGHAFCANCKRLLGDGSGRWPCPHCHQFVKEIDFQDFEFERKLFDQSVRCANTKYGCSFICLLKELAEHLKTCDFTRENALPVVFQETNTIEAVLEQLSSITRSIEKMEEKITKIETVNSVFSEQISKINTEIEDSKKNQISDKWISTLDKMKSKISNLNKKSDLWLEVLEMKEEKINKVILQHKTDFENDLQNVSSTLLDEMKINSEKINEVIANFAMQLKNTDSKIEVNKNELNALKLKTDSCMEKNDELNRVTQTLQERNIHVKNNLLDKENRIKNVNKKLEILEECVNNKSDKLNADIKPMKEEYVKMKIQQGTFDSSLKVILNRIELVSLDMHKNTTKLENLIQAQCSILNEKTDLLDQNLNLKEDKMGEINYLLKEELKIEMQEKTTNLEYFIESQCSLLQEKTNLIAEDLVLEDKKMDKINSQLRKDLRNEIKKMNSLFTEKITRLKNARDNDDKHLKNVEIKVEKNLQELIALQHSASMCLQPQNENINEINALKKNNEYLTDKVETVAETNRNLTVQIKSVVESNKILKNQIQSAVQSIINLSDHVQTGMVQADKNLTAQIKSVTGLYKILTVQTNSVTENNKYLTVQLSSLEKKINNIKPDFFHLQSCQSNINLIKQQIQPKMFKKEYSKKLADFVWQIPDAKSLLHPNTTNKRLESKVFQLNEYQFTARAKLCFTEYFLLVEINFNTGSAVIPSQPQPAVHLIIRNQVDDRAWDIIKLAYKKYKSPPEKKYHFKKIPKSKLGGLFNHYINNNNLLLEFYVEPPTMMKYAYSYDGTLSWTIDNYKKRKEVETMGYVEFHESPYFYTSPNGYRVQIHFYLNVAKDDRVFAIIHFLTGEFDQHLQQRLILPYKITITILNQRNPIGHVTKSEIFDPKKYQNDDSDTFCSSFGIPLGKTKEIEDLVVNDNLHYCAKVDAITDNA